jgi:type I restriction enzyme, S subunit
VTWDSFPLADLGTWFGGATPSKARGDFWADGTVPWLSPKDMGHDVLQRTEDSITHIAVEDSAVKLVPAGSVAVVVRSGILERTIPVGFVPFATTLNQDMKAIHPREDVDPHWIAWGLRAFERDLLRETRKDGTTVASLEWPKFQQFELPVPPLDEQRFIVQLLEDYISRLDAANDGLAGSAHRLDALKRSVLAELHDGDPIPLAELAWDSGYGTSEKCVVDGAGAPVVRIPNLVNGAVDLTEEKRVADVNADVSSAMLGAGDLLIVRTNGSVDLIGRSAVVQDGIDAAFASYLIRYRIRDEWVRPAWVQAMLSTPQVRHTIRPLAASSAGQHNLSLAKLDRLKLPVPSLEQQDAGLNRLREVERSLASLRSDIDRAMSHCTGLRRSLLAAAFSGHLTAEMATA